MKYIIIMEDGDIYQADNITDDEKDACDDGILDIINTETNQAYHGTQWHDIKPWVEVSGE